MKDKTFQETVQLRLKNDPEFRKLLIKEVKNVLLESDINTALSMLDDYLAYLEG